MNVTIDPIENFQLGLVPTRQQLPYNGLRNRL